MLDFPAAHSMDTDWFAVDIDGNLAIFDSGEGGAVPDNAQDMYIEDFIEEFIGGLLADSKGIVHLPIDGKVAADRADLESLWEEIHYGGFMDEGLLVLASEDVVEELIPEIKWRFSGVEIVVFVEGCATEKIRQLIESGKILRGIPDFYIPNNADILGLFPYDCDWQCPMPYKQLGQPIVPLKFNSLSPLLQQQVNPVRFDSLRFSETKEIQPIEHMPCATWDGDDYWFDTKRERPEWQEIDEEELEEEQE